MKSTLFDKIWDAHVVQNVEDAFNETAAYLWQAVEGKEFDVDTLPSFFFAQRSVTFVKRSSSVICPIEFSLTIFSTSLFAFSIIAFFSAGMIISSIERVAP